MRNVKNRKPKRWKAPFVDLLLSLWSVYKSYTQRLIVLRLFTLSWSKDLYKSTAVTTKLQRKQRCTEHTLKRTENEALLCFAQVWMRLELGLFDRNIRNSTTELLQRTSFALQYFYFCAYLVQTWGLVRLLSLDGGFFPRRLPRKEISNIK